MGRMREKVQGIRSVKSRYKISQREVKNNIGNGDPKELICMTHGHELNRGMLVGGGYRPKGNKGEKKWDNCNSIIKIY